jgi:hypothetical protein
MIVLRSCRTFHFKRAANDCVPDIACACRTDCHRDLGRMFVSAEIIQRLRSPGHDGQRTDFPAIAFRTTVPDPAADRRPGPDEIGPEPRALNTADRTSSNE